MRLPLAVVALVTTMAIAAAGAAAGTRGATPNNFRLDETVTSAAFHGGGCEWLDAPPPPVAGQVPTTVQVPRVGRATVSFHTSVCQSYGTLPYSVGHLYVTLTTAKGDVLVLGSHDVVEPYASPHAGDVTVAGDWTVLSGTGRFEGYSGEGTYQVTYTPPLQSNFVGYHDAHLDFAGHLGPSAQ